MTRKEARETVFELLFETDFKTDETPADVFDLASEDREIPEDKYIRGVYFGVNSHLAEIDGIINAHSHGWKTDRISRVSRTILRIAIYEMLYCTDIPATVSINEAVELCKSFDDDKVKSFVNGILNSAMKAIENPEEKVAEPENTVEAAEEAKEETEEPEEPEEPEESKESEEVKEENE